MEANAVTGIGTIEPGERKFTLDLLPVEFGSFDVMDWLTNNHAEIVIRAPTTNEEMIVTHGAGYAPTDYQTKKTQKFSHKGCVTFLAHVMEKEVEEPKLEDILVIGEYPEVFPEDLPKSSPHD